MNYDNYSPKPSSKAVSDIHKLDLIVLETFFKRSLAFYETGQPFAYININAFYSSLKIFSTDLSLNSITVGNSF